MRLCFIFICLLVLSGCDDFSSGLIAKEDIATSTFITKVKSNLVYVKGGTFMMGDFGVEHNKVILPINLNQDSKPLHEIELSSYSISKYQVTNYEYQFYLKKSGRKMRDFPAMQEEWDSLNKIGDMPAHGDWYEANNYCSWLAKESKLPFSLATEAQWEYAARSRGKYLVAPTNDGTWKIDGIKGVNIPTDRDRSNWAEKNGIAVEELSAIAVGRYPANPLGLYDMGSNGFEWVNDWYDPDYYEHSTKKDPKGPDTPTWINLYGKHSKVMRGDEVSGPGRGQSVVRNNKSPDNNGRLPIANTFRCVVNSPSPVQ